VSSDTEDSLELYFISYASFDKSAIMVLSGFARYSFGLDSNLNHHRSLCIFVKEVNK
jgi:hypothetical protein